MNLWFYFLIGLGVRFTGASFAVTEPAAHTYDVIAPVHVYEVQL